MPVSVIIGGQYGSEGKGKAALHFARKLSAAAAVKVGGTNSGHTVIGKDGRKAIFRVLPSPMIDNNIIGILPAGSYIDVDILRSEILSNNISDDRLIIDPYAIIITSGAKAAEARGRLGEAIASTCSGTGEAVIRRARRNPDVMTFAKDIPELGRYINHTKPVMREMLDDGRDIILEGTQGFGLSPLHSGLWPYCTARDTTAAAFLSEAGLSPFDVRHIVMALRSYPIRVGGNSGPLPGEISWEGVTERSAADIAIKEYASVTKRLRRVAEFDDKIVKAAIAANKPDVIIMNHLDYIDWSCHGKNIISPEIENFIRDIEAKINAHIDIAGTGEDILIERI